MEARKLAVEDLERVMRNCRHGGPSPDEQPSAWFQACQWFVGFVTTPLDRLVDDETSSAHHHHSQDIIRDAVASTVSLIVDHPTLNVMRASPGSVRYFGALAVDAWIANDMPYVQKFLVNGILLERLQHFGPDAIMREMTVGNNSDRRRGGTSTSRLVEHIQQVLQQDDENIKSHMEHLTRGSCECIIMAQVLRDDEEQQDEGGNEATNSIRRREREIAQLPPILKPDSRLWPIKKKAAARLKAGRLEESTELYLQALQLVEDQFQTAQEHGGVVWIRKLAKEASKIESNLSMIFVRRQKPEKALLHAEVACGHDPAWSKPDCRMALALEALGRLEEAEAAVCTALDCLEREILKDKAPTPTTASSTREEYHQIQQRIEASLRPSLDEPSSVRTLRINPEQADVGSLSSLFGVPLVFDTVTTYLTPRDVARLEQTCRGFAAQPEKRRRFALSSPLWNLQSIIADVEYHIRMYCGQNLHDPSSALRELVASILELVPPNSETMVPRWIRIMLEHSNVWSRNIIESVCVRLGPPCLRKALCYWVRDSVLVQMLDFVDESDSDDAFLKHTYQYDNDGEVLRLTTWLEPFVDEARDPDVGLVEVSDIAFITLSNLIASRGERVRARIRRVGMTSPIAVQTGAVATVFAAYVPSKWPCEQLLEQSWEYNIQDIENYWTNSEPRVFRRWKNAFAKLFQWLHETEEKCGHEYILVQQTTLLEENPRFGRGTAQVNAISLALFLMKKYMEHGGTTALKLSLISQRDYSELIADYYSMIRVYHNAFPRILEWRDRTIAQHQMMRG